MEYGRDEFYKGETAKKLVEFIQNNGGIITLNDLESYEPFGEIQSYLIMMD